jgi:hypothetical protein
METIKKDIDKKDKGFYEKIQLELEFLYFSIVQIIIANMLIFKFV